MAPPQPAQRPAMHMPPTPGQPVPWATHSPVPPPVQQPLLLQTRPAQQGSLGPPQPMQVPVPPAVPTHMAPAAVQVRPGQQGPPEAPQAWQRSLLVLQTRPAPLQTANWQQTWFWTPPQPEQVPLLHVPPVGVPLPSPRAKHMPPLATQR